VQRVFRESLGLVAGETGLQGPTGLAGVAGATGIQGQTGLGTQGQTGVGSPTTFVSTKQTDTGSAQSIPHGLGVTPTKVLVSITDNSAIPAFVIVEGTHTSTDVVVTVTTGDKFKVLAMP